MSLLTRQMDEMRKRADWMRAESDDAILELIREYGNLTPSAIEKLGGPVSGHASSRCRALAKHGMLIQIDRGLYGISDAGLQYLDEELDASTLEEDDDLVPLAERETLNE